jgi:hypothetical protein
MAKKRAPSRQPNVDSDYDPIARFEREPGGRLYTPRPDGSNVERDYYPIARFEREPGGRLYTPPRRSRRTAAPPSKEPTPTSTSKKTAASTNKIPNFVSDYIKDNPTTASQSGCVAAWKRLHGSHRRGELITEWKTQAEPLGLLRKRGQHGQIAKR